MSACKDSDNQLCYGCLKGNFYMFYSSHYITYYPLADCNTIEWGKKLSDMNEMERENVERLRNTDLSYIDGFISQCESFVADFNNFKADYPDYDFNDGYIQKLLNSEDFKDLKSIKEYLSDNFAKWS